MKKFDLSAHKRSILGKKVKKLRMDKILPANIYGKNIKSEAIQLPTEDFKKVFKQASQSNLINLDVDGKKQMVLVQNIQVHPLTNEFLHIDFYQVNLKEKVKTKVPVELIGKAPAVDQKLGLILELLDEIEIEALPTNLPDKLTIDVSILKALGDAVKVSDLKMPEGVLALTKSDAEIVKIGELVTKEAEKLAAEEAAIKAAAVAQTAAAAPQDAQAPTTATPKAEAAPQEAGKTAEPKPKA